jgi:hypothetical protein
MSTESGSIDEKPLSFERAEYDSPPQSVACSVCSASPKDAYFRCGQATLCARCAEEFRAGRLPVVHGGFLRALGYGVLAALAGSCVYYLIRAVTGYEFGLIGIVVGLVVGGAVHAGSGGRGGRLYQVLAVLLIYLAIVSTYVPDVLSAMAESGAAQNAIEQGLRVVFAVAISLVAPFLLGLENLIGLIILGISMYEGWKINVRQPVPVEGPFPLARGSADEAPAQAA